MIRYDTYVKFSIEGLVAALDDELAGASPKRRAAIEEERSALLTDYDVFVNVARALPRFDSGLFDRIFPRRSKRGELYLRVKPGDAAEAIAFLSVFEAHPLGHLEGDRVVTPWTAESETHRIFPYTFIVQLRPSLFCRLIWCYEYSKAEFIYVRLQLPNDLIQGAVDEELGVLKDGMFVAGLCPYVYAKTTTFGRRLGLHFPKAYTPTEDGRFRLLGWQDIPLLRGAERTTPTTRLSSEPTPTPGTSTARQPLVPLAVVADL